MLALLLVLAIILLVLFFVVVRVVIGLVVLLVVAGLCGAAAEFITGYKTGNVIYTVAAGLIGAVIGTLIAGLLNLPRLVSIAGVHVVWAVIGAVILLAILKAVRPRGFA